MLRAAAASPPKALATRWPPKPVEALGAALAPISAGALLAILAALLLEQKVLLVSSDPLRLVPAAHALLSLLYPLRWRNVCVPLCPPSLAAVVSAPFPYLIGLTSLDELPSGGESARQPARGKILEILP